MTDSEKELVSNDGEFCLYSLHTTGWEYDLYNACGDKPIRLFSVNERKHCKRCGRKMMFIPEPVKPVAQSLVERLRDANGGWVSDHALEAADAIERLVKERDEARAKTAISMGVGDGSGNLFVYGDYDSIKAAQGFVSRIEELVSERGHAAANAARYLEFLNAAEAEVVNLKKAMNRVEAIAAGSPLCPATIQALKNDMKRIVTIARAALEAKHD